MTPTPDQPKATPLLPLNDEGLMPCPFCASDEVQLVPDLLGGVRVFTAQCFNCSSQGANKLTPESAREVWNTRPSASAAKNQPEEMRLEEAVRRQDESTDEQFRIVEEWRKSQAREEEILRLRKALEFYADHNHYRGSSIGIETNDGWKSDFGHVARSALSQGGEEGGEGIGCASKGTILPPAQEDAASRSTAQEAIDKLEELRLSNWIRVHEALAAMTRERDELQEMVNRLAPSNTNLRGLLDAAEREIEKKNNELGDICIRLRGHPLSKLHGPDGLAEATYRSYNIAMNTIARLDNTLLAIGDYWNGAEASAVDAAEAMRKMADEARCRQTDSPSTPPASTPLPPPAPPTASDSKTKGNAL